MWLGVGVITVAVLIGDCKRLLSAATGGGAGAREGPEEEERKVSFLSLLDFNILSQFLFFLSHVFPSPIVVPPLLPPLSHVPASYNDRTKSGFVAGCIAPG